LIRVNKFAINTEREITALCNKLHLNEIKIDKPISFKWNLKPNDFDSAGKLSSEIKKILKKKIIDRICIRKISIAVYEAEINTIIHSYGGYAIIKIDNEKFHAKFIDNGPGIENIELAMQAGYSTASQLARELGFGAGMGLPNIKKSVDYFELNSKPGVGTTLIFEVYFNKPQNKKS